jgi:hypothetical protein
MKWIWEKAPEVIGRLVGCSAVLYILGFLVFRARMNALGVPGSALGVVDQTYLIAGGELLVVTLDLLVRSAWWVTFPAMGALSGLWLLGLRWLEQRRHARLLLGLRGSFTVLTIGLFVLSLEGAAHVLLNGPRTPEAIAALSQGDWISTYVFAALTGIAGAVLLCLAFSVPDLFVARKAVQTSGSLIGILSALVLPMAFGVATVPRDYPVAQVEVRDAGAATESFLFFSNEKSTVTYREGVVRIVPGERILSITIPCRARLAKEPRCESGKGQ